MIGHIKGEMSKAAMTAVTLNFHGIGINSNTGQPP